MMKVDPVSFIPIFEQVKQGIKREITLGVLRPQQPLPSIRDLAADLIVNPNTVARAYRELEREGFIETRQGRRSVVAGNSTALVGREREIVIGRIFSEAIAEARRFSLSDAEIKSLLGRKLRGSEADSSRKGADDAGKDRSESKSKGGKHG